MKILSKADLVVGLRVRLIHTIGGNYPGSMYEIAPGLAGSVVKVLDEQEQTDNNSIVAHIKFDDVVEDLATWDYALAVWDADGDECGDAVLQNFEIISAHE